jgi:hypothetical protein
MSITLKQLQKTFEETDFTPDPKGTIENRQYGIDIAEIAQELADNSADAGAANCNFYVIPHSDSDETVNRFACLDDGCGMSAAKLMNAIILSKHHEHNTTDTGKFGEGMKNAMFGLGDEILILTKEKDSQAVGTYLDLVCMKENNTFKPTSFNIAENYKDRISNVLWEKFIQQESGTLIHVKSLHDTHLTSVKNIISTLNEAFKFAYNDNRAIKICVNSSLKMQSTPIKPLDVFYQNNSGALECLIETTLIVNYLSTRKIEVYEELTGKRYRGGRGNDEKEISGTSAKPSYYKFASEVPKGKGNQVYDNKVHTPIPVLPEEGTKYRIPIRMIKVKEDAYKNEGKESAYASVPNRRRGGWFYRSDRLVKAASNLGLSLDDHDNRIRFQATFPPALDAAMGVRTQKQLGNHIPNEAIHAALVILWKQVGLKLRDKVKKENTDDDSSSVVSAVTNVTAKAATKKVKKTEPPAPVEASKSPSPPPIPEDNEHVFDADELVFDDEGNLVSGEIPSEAVDDTNGANEVDTSRPELPSVPLPPTMTENVVPKKTSAPYAINDIGFDIGTQQVIITDELDGRELARFHSHGIGSHLRDRYQMFCEKMGRDRFIEFLAEEKTLLAKYNV